MVVFQNCYTGNGKIYLSDLYVLDLYVWGFASESQEGKVVLGKQVIIIYNV